MYRSVKFILKGSLSSLRKQPTVGDASRYHWFSRQMTSEKRAPKFRTDDASLPRSGQCLWLVLPRGKFDSTNQKHYPDLGSDASSVWNSALVSQTSFGGETSGSVAKCLLFSQAIVYKAVTFLSDARQPEVSFFAPLSRDFKQVFGQIVSIRVKTLSNTNVVTSRKLKIEKGSLPGRCCLRLHLLRLCKTA